MTSGTIIAAISTLIITGGFDILLVIFLIIIKFMTISNSYFFLWLQTVKSMILAGFEINAVVYLVDEENPRPIISKLILKFSPNIIKIKNNELQEKDR